MSDGASGNSEKRPMTTADSVGAEMAQIMRTAAGPMQPGESIQDLIRRAARRTGISYGRAKRLWYQEVRRIAAHEADNLRAWYGHYCEAQARRYALETELYRARRAALENRRACTPSC